MNDGVLLCRADQSWRPVAHDIPSVNHIHAEHEASVWACGRHGILLHGNYIDGFKRMLEPDRSRHYVSVVSYNRQIFLATETGLFSYENGAVHRLMTGLGGFKVTMELFSIVRVHSMAPQSSAIDGMCSVILGILQAAEGNWYAVSIDSQSWMVFKGALQDTGSKAAPSDIHPSPCSRLRGSF